MTQPRQACARCSGATASQPRWPASSWVWRTLGGLSLITLAGCATPPPAPPLLYLPGDEAVTSARPGGTADLPKAAALGDWRLVTPIALPAALDREAVMVAIAPGQWLPWQGLRWAEPLRDAVPRVLLVDLAALRGGAVWAGRAAPGRVAARDLRIDIDEWEASLPQREVSLRARWVLSAPDRLAATVSGSVRLRAPWPAATPGGLVQAQRAALRTLATEVVDQAAAEAARSGTVGASAP